MSGWKRGRSLTRAGTLVFVVAAVGYFVAVGAADAGDLVGTVIMVIGLAGVAVALYGLVLTRKVTASRPPIVQTVTGAVGGHVTQVDTIAGDLVLGAPPASPGTGVAGENATRIDEAGEDSAAGR